VSPVAPQVKVGVHEPVTWRCVWLVLPGFLHAMSEPHVFLFGLLGMRAGVIAEDELDLHAY